MLPFPQLIVPTFDATVPLPVTVTLSAYVCSTNCALTERACDIVTWHVPVPLQPSPDQPLNVQPVSGDAVSVTTVPAVYLLVQLAPQLKLPTSAVTAPDPVLETSSV